MEDEVGKKVGIFIFVIFVALFMGPMMIGLILMKVEFVSTGFGGFGPDISVLKLNKLNIDSKVIIIILSALVLFFVIMFIIKTFNKLMRLKQKTKQSASGIDVYLKQRFDLIPNIVNTVKKYASYEKEVLENITNIRNDYSKIKDENIKEKAEINNEYNKILAVVERYPELKANESFLNLQRVLSKIESQLQAARRIYNCDVTEYNIVVQSFPSNIIAKIFKFRLEKLFEIEVYEKNNIEIKM